MIQIIHHLLLHGRVMVIFKKYKELYLLNIICNWHVSSFAILSGLLSNKSFRFSNLLYLWFQTIFYSIIFYIKYDTQKTTLFNTIMVSNLFPVIHQVYWYFTAYFGIYPFLPFINAGISTLSKIEVKMSIYFMIGIFIIWSSFFNDRFSQNDGKSPFSILIFYTFGTYIGKYKFKKNSKMLNRILICVICLSIYIIATISCYNIYVINCFPKINFKLKRLFRISIICYKKN